MSNNNAVNSIENTHINRYRGCYTLGHQYSVARIAECADACRNIIQREGKLPKTHEFVTTAKFSSVDLETYLAR